MSTNYSKGLSVYGIPVVPNAGGIQTSGNVFFVNSGNVDGADDIGTKGKRINSPFVTLKYALSQTTASNGDMIYVLPGHSENINTTAALAFNVAGVAIIGMGWGNLRPTFNLSTSGSNKSRIGITSANVMISNLIFRANSTAIGSSSVGISIGANDCSIVNCQFDHTSTLTYYANTIEITNGVNRYNILNNYFLNHGVASQSQKAIDMRSTGSAQIGGRIDNNYFVGNWSGSVIRGSSNSSFRNLNIWNNFINQNGTGSGAKGINVNSSKVVSRAGNISYNHIAYSATGVTSTIGIVTRNGWTLSRNYVNRSSSAGNAVGGISS